MSTAEDKKARAASAADELAASIRALQTEGLDVKDIRDTIGLERETLIRLMSDWGLDR